MADEKTIFTTMLLGVNENNEERYLYTGFSNQAQPVARKQNDIMFIIDTFGWFQSIDGEWIKLN